MPKKTFLNLEGKKRKQITDAFLREFAVRYFDEASISMVVKQLGIAKGSVYQYFDDKLDIFTYLISECSAVKQRYTASVDRKDYPDFWAYFRALYEKGYLFDADNPLHSHFLHKLSQNLSSPSVKKLYNELLEQVVRAFEYMVEYEMKEGLFRSDLPVRTLGFLLYKIGSGVQEQLEYSGVINPKESIRNSLPVYHGKKEELMRAVDEYILLVRPAFEKY